MLHTLPGMSHAQLMGLPGLLIPLRGVFILAVAGVQLHLDVAAEDLWVDLSPGYDEGVLLAVVDLLDRAGLELMDEVGSLEEDEDGTIRNYIAQTWFPEEITTGEGLTKAS